MLDSQDGLTLYRNSPPYFPRVVLASSTGSVKHCTEMGLHRGHPLLRTKAVMYDDLTLTLSQSYFTCDHKVKIKGSRWVDSSTQTSHSVIYIHYGCLVALTLSSSFNIQTSLSQLKPTFSSNLSSLAPCTVSCDLWSESHGVLD